MLRTFPRQALHARSLAFEHPATGAPMTFTTPLPEDFETLLAVLRTEDPDVG
jgi:23S rRNA pseudouridine1911/1915/1917 synthase